MGALEIIALSKAVWLVRSQQQQGGAEQRHQRQPVSTCCACHHLTEQKGPCGNMMLSRQKPSAPSQQTSQVSHVCVAAVATAY